MDRSAGAGIASRGGPSRLRHAVDAAAEQHLDLLVIDTPPRFETRALRGGPRSPAWSSIPVEILEQPAASFGEALAAVELVPPTGGRPRTRRCKRSSRPAIAHRACRPPLGAGAAVVLGRAADRGGGAARESTTTSSPVLLVRRAGDTGSGVAAAACWRPGWGGRVRSMVRSRWSTLPKVISTSRRRASMPRTRRRRPRLRRPASVTGSWFVRAVISVPFAVLGRQSRSYRHSRLVGAQNCEVHVPPMTRGM